MTKVYQTIVDKENGNCMQAVVASLFDLELKDVPHFLEFKDKCFQVFHGFFKDREYQITTIGRHRDKNTDFLKKVAHFDGGINGYFYASVQSKIYPSGGHAVVVDKNLNVVHDPNPKGIYLDLLPDDIESIVVVHRMVTGKTGKLFSEADWDSASQEERDLNTYRCK